jgi:hypothetical protein
VAAEEQQQFALRRAEGEKAGPDACRGIAEGVMSSETLLL